MKQGIYCIAYKYTNYEYNDLLIDFPLILRRLHGPTLPAYLLLPTPYTAGTVANQQTRRDSITVAGAALVFNQLPDYPQGRVNALEAPCGA